MVTLGTVSEEDAKQRCLSLNLFRRHMTAEEQQEARAGRIARVAASRAAGKSIRTIAAEEQVSKTQVAKDLEDNPAAPRPATVTGRNGVAYPGRRKRPRPRTGPAARAQAAALKLAASVRAVLRQSGSPRARLEALAAAAGFPIEGDAWPALDAIQAVLRDAATGAASA